MSSKRAMLQRLQELEAYAESRTMKVADFVHICDCFLTACATYVDTETMTKITQECDGAFRRTLGRTFDWTWRQQQTPSHPSY